MKVVDIHPEELIDKLTDGSLTVAERERLNAHLVQCSSCRFEIAVRADLAEDVPAFEQRPQLTVTGDARNARASGSPREQPAPQSSRSLRARSRRRWPLAMLAAGLVLCAGGAMAAVITGAVSAHWPRWSSEPKQIESGVRVSDAKPGLKSKRAVVEPAPTLAPASEASASTATSATPEASNAASATPEASALPPPVGPSRSASAHPRQAGAVLARPDSTRSAAVAALPATSSSAEASATRTAPAAATPAAAMFADANRARRDGNVDRAVGLYRALQSRYPSSSESELSRALLAQLLLDRGNPEAALAGFDRYLSADSPVLGAEALVGRARALEQLGKPTQAAAAWRQVQSRFPGSVHARLAATRLAALGMQ